MKIQYGRHTIIPTIKRSDRKSIAVSVLPDKKVLVKAPKTAKTEILKKILSKKAAWIVKQQYHFDRFLPLQPPRKYISGETHYYVGRQYRLKIKKNNRPEIHLKGRFFQIELQDCGNRKKVKALLDNWYLNHARTVFNNSLNIYWPILGINGKERPLLEIKNMYKSWGSFSKNKKITLNVELVKASRYCIDYVLVHELCHLLHHRHDHGFYRLLKRVLPDWEKRKEKLEAYSF